MAMVLDEMWWERDGSGPHVPEIEDTADYFLEPVRLTPLKQPTLLHGEEAKTGGEQSPIKVRPALDKSSAKVPAPRAKAPEKRAVVLLAQFNW